MQGCQSIYNICILNDCKLTWRYSVIAFYKGRTASGNIPTTDGDVQNHYRVFQAKNSKFKNWHRTPIFEPALVSAASTDGRGIKAHDVCIKTVQDARF